MKNSCSGAPVFRKINLVAKVVAVVAAAVMLTAAALWAAASREMWSELEVKQEQDGEQYIRSLALVYAGRVKDAKVTLNGSRVARIESPSLASFSDFSVVDDSVAYVGGNATIFTFDSTQDAFVRRTTTVKKENGERAVGTKLAPESPAQAYLRRGEAYYGPTLLFGRHFYTVYQPTFDSAGNVNGALYVGIPIEAYFNAYNSTMRSMGLMAALTAVLICVGAGLIAARLFQPLRAISSRVDALAQGDLASPIGHQERGDEIGAVARALEVLRETSLRAQSLEEQQRDVEQGNARRRADLDAAIQEFRYRATGLLTSLTSSTQGMRGRAEEMSGVSENARDAIEQASGSSREASTNVQMVASAAEELSASINEIGGQLDRAKTLAERALNEAETTNSEIGGLAQAAQRIGDVVDLIRSIAEQTNLLALNATIEAARAGEAGRGFAVVAAEVKTLATQTAKATEEITKQIQSVQTSTDGAVDAIRRITGRMREINETTVGIAASVVQQGSATEEISRNVAQAAHGTKAMAQSLVTVTGAAQRTSETAVTVTGAAQQADGVAGELEREIESFLRRVAA